MPLFVFDLSSILPEYYIIVPMTTIDNLLQDHPVLKNCRPEVRSRLAGLAVKKQYQADETLVLAGDPWPYLFLVAEGCVSALKESHDGRSLVLVQLGQGELFWGLSFFQDDLANPVTLQSSLPSTIYLWSREQILPLLLENGSLTWELASLMVQRMLHASDVIEGLAFQPVAGRLARLLLDHFTVAGEPAIKRSLTLDEMAARVGTTREMVCRALYRFADRDLIEVTRTEFVLTDRKGLTRLAEGE